AHQWSADLFRPKDDWLLQEALALIETLLPRLEAGPGLPQEEQIALADLRALAREAGVIPPPPIKALPWLLRVERVVFGHWEEVLDETIRCPDCGSTQVARKSRKPRMKKFYDEARDLQEVPVYRYYCRNQGCPRKTFTHFPPGLVPYSRHRLEVHLLALQAYAWSYSTYRRAGQSLGVAQITVYRWVSAWGYRLLPVGAIFGVVRSSGVVGVDEKYVKVPKNDKPQSKMKRWMYVYLAVDAYTLDLLHIAIYPHNSKDSARTFLLALRAKGYHPKVIVTDLRRDYGEVVAQVFSHAQHHECIFHALKEVRKNIREVYGADYRETHPEAVALEKAIQRIFAVKTKRTAHKRWQAVLALRQQYVEENPAAQAIFDFLQRHRLTLLNAVESQLIPTTNNAVERVIGRFEQHYQGFRGFESIETAQVYLGVFEKLYRFTPFSNDAQQEIRGKSPLELAGYDLGQIPMAVLCRGLSPQWPTEVIMQEEVPKP
ncbi:MAG: DDE-type integrase/transposase/recombinase, partial [Anaerolineae bacterium]